MAKKLSTPETIMRYWPILIIVASGVVAFIKLEGSVQASQSKQVEVDKRIEKVENQQDQLYENSVEQKVQTAQISQKMDLVLEYIKDSHKK